VNVSGDKDGTLAFHRMMFAVDDSNTWVLNDPVDRQGRTVWSMTAFNEGRVVREGLTVTTFSEGPRTDVHVGALGILYMRPSIAAVVAEVAGEDVERYPIAVDGVDGQWELVNTPSEIDCIAHDRAGGERFPQDFPNPRARGMYRRLHLVLRAEAVQGKHLVRPIDFPVALLVSEAIRRVLVNRGATGVRFEAAEVV
jgi:hypothetical protein